MVPNTYSVHNITAATVLKLIPENLEAQPVFLCIDDTMIPKFGAKLEDASKLFDHAAGAIMYECKVKSRMC